MRASTLVTADTARTPNEGYTAGSHSMQDSGTAILQRRGAGARDPASAAAAQRLGVAAGAAAGRGRRVRGAGRPHASATASWSPGKSLHVQRAAAVAR